MVKKPDTEAEAQAPAKPAKPAVDHENMNIYQKIAAITGEVGSIAKGGTNKEQGYAFIEYAAVAGELRGLFAKYGVVIVPNMGTLEHQQREVISTKSGKAGVALLLPFKFDIVNADKPDDRFTVDWLGEATDYGDKATNKAATAALKYYLMRQFNISEKGEQESDAQTIERDYTHEPPRIAAPKLITQEQIDEISEILTAKGMSDTAHQKKLVAKMANVTDPMQIKQATATALTERIRAADVNKMFEYIGEQPLDTEATILEEMAKDDADDQYNPPDATDRPPVDDDIVDENERTVATRVKPVDDTFKAGVRRSLDALGLKPVERMRLLKDATGAVTDKNLTEHQWRMFADAIDEYAINMADRETAAETPQIKTTHEGAQNENTETNDTSASA